MNWTRTQFSIVVIVSTTAFLSTFLISAVNVALPVIEKEFAMDAITLSWVVTSFLLSTAMFLLPSGRIADLTGIRKVFKVGVVIFALSSLLCGLSGSGTWLIVFRFIQGIGAALSSTTGPAILVGAFSPSYRGRVLGIIISAVYFGLALGPFAGGILTQYFGWRSLFYFSFVSGVIASAISFLFLGTDPVSRLPAIRPRFRGTLFYMAGLTALVYGVSLIPGAFGWAIMAAGMICLFVFWWIEMHSESPVIDLKLFIQNRLFAWSNLAALINYSSTFSIVFLLSLYLQKIKGLSPLDAGAVLIAQPVVMAVFSPLTGRLADKMDSRYIATAGMAMCALGLFSLAWLGQDTSLPVIISILVWVGLGFALFSSPNMSTIMGSVRKDQLGIASGSSATMRVVGQILSMTITTAFFAIFFDGQAVENVSDTVFLSTMRLGFITFALISGSGIYFSFYRGSLPGKGRT